MSTKLTAEMSGAVPSTCPHCQASLIGAPISEEARCLVGGAHFWNRVIAHYDHDKDMTVAWQCPDCGKTWKRK